LNLIADLFTVEAGYRSPGKGGHSHFFSAASATDGAQIRVSAGRLKSLLWPRPLRSRHLGGHDRAARFAGSVCGNRIRAVPVLAPLVYVCSTAWLILLRTSWFYLVPTALAPALWTLHMAWVEGAWAHRRKGHRNSAALAAFVEPKLSETGV
jgi:hypothetical protein